MESRTAQDRHDRSPKNFPLHQRGKLFPFWFELYAKTGALKRITTDFARLNIQKEVDLAPGVKVRVVLVGKLLFTWRKLALTKTIVVTIALGMRNIQKRHGGKSLVQ